jgi:hypothetical protein
VELYIHFSARLYGVAFIEHEHQYRSQGPSLNCVCSRVRSVAPRSCQSKDTILYRQQVHKDLVTCAGQAIKTVAQKNHEGWLPNRCHHAVPCTGKPVHEDGGTTFLRRNIP